MLQSIEILGMHKSEVCRVMNCEMFSNWLIFVFFFSIFNIRLESQLSFLEYLPLAHFLISVLHLMVSSKICKTPIKKCANIEKKNARLLAPKSYLEYNEPVFTDLTIHKYISNFTRCKCERY